MSDLPIQIRKPEVVRDIRALAELSGRSITDAVGEAVRRSLDEQQRALAVDRDARRARVRAVLARIAVLPITGQPVCDDDLYDAEGFPR
jgi:hypothetical protein